MLSKAPLIAGAAASAIAAAFLTAWAFQSRFVFEPESTLHARPADFPFPVVKRSFPLHAADPRSDTLVGWWILSTRARPKVILYFHGNDGNVSTRVREVAELRPLQHFIFMVDYRGYGESRGAFPTEQSVYEDAEAAWSYLTRTHGFAPSDIYLCGFSLGGAIAIELALRHPDAAGLIVESSFTSIRDMAELRSVLSVLPLLALLNQRFASIDKVARLRMPVLYIHGTDDDVVPFRMGEELYAASGGHKKFLAVEGARHDDVAAVGGRTYLNAIGAFMGDSAGRPPARLDRRDDPPG